MSYREDPFQRLVAVRFPAAGAAPQVDVRRSTIPFFNPAFLPAEQTWLTCSGQTLWGAFPDALPFPSSNQVTLNFTLYRFEQFGAGQVPLVTPPGLRQTRAPTCSLSPAITITGQSSAAVLTIPAASVTHSGTEGVDNGGTSDATGTEDGYGWTGATRTVTHSGESIDVPYLYRYFIDPASDVFGIRYYVPLLMDTLGFTENPLGFTDFEEVAVALA